MSYTGFIQDKTQWGPGCGLGSFELPSYLYDFQCYLTEFALQMGRAAIFADCGSGKTAMEFAWADQVIRARNKPVLLLTPLAVAQQMIAESVKFGVDARRSKDGKITSDKCVWITNYQNLHKFNPDDFAGVICDESSAVKDFKSQTKATVVDFLRTVEFRLLCSATAAPNDYFELGTSSEALGLLGFRDMLTRFFKLEENKGGLGWGKSKYRFRGHAQEPFWSWTTSWSRAMRRPSDLGFDDKGFDLPELIQHEYVVDSAHTRDGMLFPTPASTLHEQRQERRGSIQERCEKINEVVESHDGPSVMWCELNDEGNLLEKMVDGAVQVSGSMSDDKKEEYLNAFSSGEISRLVTKPKIGAWGLNWQHCSNVAMLPSHSFEQYYQAVRRCYRFKQENDVHVHLVVTEGERGVLESLARKQRQCDMMFNSIVEHMKDSLHLNSFDNFENKEMVPKWL